MFAICLVGCAYVGHSNPPEESRLITIPLILRRVGITATVVAIIVTADTATVTIDDIAMIAVAVVIFVILLMLLVTISKS
jgi:hypothetical protein